MTPTRRARHRRTTSIECPPSRRPDPRSGASGRTDQHRSRSQRSDVNRADSHHRVTSCRFGPGPAGRGTPPHIERIDTEYLTPAGHEQATAALGALVHHWATHRRAMTDDTTATGDIVMTADITQDASDADNAAGGDNTG
jgi:hypothetical protein